MMLMIGACKIAPPSAKAALAIVMWFYGTIPGASWSTYQQIVEQQYVAAKLDGKAAVKHLEACFAGET